MLLVKVLNFETIIFPIIVNVCDIVASIPFYVVLIRLIGFVWGFDVVSLPNDSNIAFDISFATRCDVIWIREDGPLVVKLVFWMSVNESRKTRKIL